jgi:hypothetical protein
MEFANSLKDKKDSSFTTEERDKLVEAGVDANEFVWNGEEFIYLGNTMEELINALQDNTKIQTENAINKLENKIGQGEQFKGFVENA